MSEPPYVPPPGHQTTRRSVRPVDSRGRLEAPVPDTVAIEEPLEIRVAGDPIVTTMRTPGHDHLLAMGFLFAEGIVRSTADVSTIAHCGRPADEGYGNVIDVLPGPGTVLDASRLKQAKRGTLMTSACGICGHEQIDDLLKRVEPVRPAKPLSIEVLRNAPRQLGAKQDLFKRTGSVHAAAALSEDGAVLAFAEDVGRHNAVDKVVGQLLITESIGESSHPPYPRILVVSGRTSFEIVQKAAAAQVGAVASVSGVSSLAIDLAEAAGITLAGFVREDSTKIYTHAERIREPFL